MPADRKYRIEPRAVGTRCATCGITLGSGEAALWCAIRECATTPEREPSDLLKRRLMRATCATPRQVRAWTPDQ
jgi:hypothetical protein